MVIDRQAKTNPNVYQSGALTLMSVDQGYGAGSKVIGVSFSCVSITTSRDIRVRAPDRGSLGLVFACLSITTSRDIRVRAPDRGSLGLGFACLSMGH